MIKFIFIFCVYGLSVSAQPTAYTTANAHSHNDYEQPIPFWEAYNHGFGSIEADIFLLGENDELLVAHTPAELKVKKRRLDSLYLIPIVNCLKKNQGTPYADKSRKLQILVDIKTSATATLQKLVKTIARYPELTNNPLLQFAISGNRPDPDSFYLFPPYIMFDGEINKTYSKNALSKIVLMSDNLKRYTLWNGKGDIPAGEQSKLRSEILRCHELKKPVRFWEAPDDISSWKTLMMLKVDYLNTDKIAELSAFLNK